MPDLPAFLPGLLIVLLVAVMVWFTIGTQRNVSRGNRVLEWLQDGLGALGPRTTLRWLGSSVAELSIIQPRAPYREAMVLVVLEPRDLGALWALSRRRGRRDFIVLRLGLVKAPMVRADLIDPASWTAEDRRRDEPEPDRHGTWIDADGRSIGIWHDGGTDLAALQTHWNALRRDSGGAWRVSVRPTLPHLEVHILVPDMGSASARRLLDEVGTLARSLSAR